MGIMTENHMSATEYANQRAAYYTPNQPFVKATEVLEETEKRCSAGQQYTTFSEQISDEEKAKVEAKGYMVTRNYVQSKNRDGAPSSDNGMYIGFQVALNAIAASGHRPMQISEEEDNGISVGFTPTPEQLNAMNSGVTAEDVQLIGTHSTQISEISGEVTDVSDKVSGIKETDSSSITMENDAVLYISNTVPTGDIPDNASGIGF